MSYIAVIDYDIGNIKSILNALEKIGVKACLTRDEEEINNAIGVILPGVGAFNHGMAKLDEYGLTDVLRSYPSSGKPLMGICLGMQMLFDSSEEFGFTSGLGIIPGKVIQLETYNASYEKLPHVSWNELTEPSEGKWQGTILDAVRNQADMYFVHSFVAKPESDDDLLSSTNYSGNNFCSSVAKGNVFGCQFHPEKSADEGLKIINNFVKLCKV